MIGSLARSSLWPLAMIVMGGSGLTLQACSGKVQEAADCRSDASCGGATGASGGKGEGGSGAVSGGSVTSEAGTAAVSETCSNAIKDSDESDVDCGGSKCNRCLVDQRCEANDDCETALCRNNRCTEPTCKDGIKDQDETGMDCGGSCKPCANGVACLANSDCRSAFCADQVCTDHCTNRLLDGDETDLDCGGPTCLPCTESNRCLLARDCQSSLCTASKCVKPDCNDQIKNQDESDVDCGGVCGSSCPIAARCNTAADCANWVCSTDGKCLADRVIPPGDVIDDFEDANLVLPSPALGGRVGTWYGFGDGTGIGTVSVVASKRGVSVNALRAMGKEFVNWGSGFAVDLDNSGSGDASKLSYDASAYTGITFWARAKAATTVTVALPDVDTDTAGNVCKACSHHYFKTVSLSTSWQRFIVSFSDLTLEAGGAPIPGPFNASGLFSVQFRLGAGVTYDVYVDDLAFIKG